MEIEDLKERLRKSLQVIQKLQGQLDAAKAVHATAVIGVSCKLPGNINDLEDLWDFLYKGGNAITNYPQDRLSGLGYKETDAAGIKGGFINDIEFFDPAFFNIGLQEASAMDPQHRMLLELTWRAFEDAGLNIQAYRGKRVGVFIALSNNDYSLQRLRTGGEHTNPYDFTGNILAPAAGRISYAFDFRGPSTVVDTACSSALVAFHQAHIALNNNECDLAIVGGMNLILDLQINKALQSIEALAADGYCKPLDASADGYTRSEGGGVMILKRVADVDAVKDKPYCIVKGSCVNHDGHSNGFTAPSGHAQEAVLNDALKAAGLNKGDINYIELHGTGTALGDPIEVDAIQNVFLNNERTQPLYIGSVKSNMGHLECAAGLAGLFKSILVLKHKIIPPTIHIRKLNPLIDWQVGLQIPLMPQRVAGGEDKVRVGISSFGISGTNAHIIIESIGDTVYEAGQQEVSCPLFLSAANPNALKQLITDYISFLGRTQQGWRDICAATAAHTHWPYRVAITASSCKEAVDKLKAITHFDNEVQRKQVAGGYATVAELTDACISLIDSQNKNHIDTLVSKNGHGIAELLSLFYTSGIDCDWNIFLPLGKIKIHLPGYPFSKIKCWVNKERPVVVSSGLGNAISHPVFTQRFSVPGEEDVVSFTGTVSLKQLPWLNGHKLFDTVVFPGAGFLEWMLFAASSIGKDKNAVSQLTLKEPLVLIPDTTYAIWLKTTATDKGYACKAYSKVQDATQWVLHAECEITEVNIQPLAPINADGVKLDVLSFYKQCNKAGIGYTDAFAKLAEAQVNGRNLTGVVNWKTPVTAQAFTLHPALTDNCFQLLGAYIMSNGATDAYVPYKMDVVRQYGDIIDGKVDVLIQLPNDIQPGFNSLKVDVSVWQAGEVKADIRGFYLVKVSREQLVPLLGNELKQHVYKEQWVDAPLALANNSRSLYNTADFSHCLDGIDALLAGRAAQGLHLLEGLAVHWSAYILQELDVPANYSKAYSSNEWMQVLGIELAHTRLFEELLSVAVANKWAVNENSSYTFSHIPATDIDAEIAVLAENKNILAELSVLNRCAGNIAGILKGTTNPVEVLFPSGSIEYVKALYASDAFKVMHELTAATFTNFLDINKDKGALKILEIGSGTGSTTKQVLPLLKGWNVAYDFTDISPLFLHEAQNALQEYEFLNYRVLDIEKDLLQQGYELGSYDVIIASNVLHATRVLKNTFGNVNKLLKNDGVLFMVEGTHTMLWIDLIFGITSGWWLFDDTDLRPSHALLSEPQWKDFLSKEGFRNIQVLSPAIDNVTVSGQAVIWAENNAGCIDNKPLLLLGGDRKVPLGLEVFDRVAVYDELQVPADRVLIVPVDTTINGETLVDITVKQTNSVLSALCVLAQQEDKRTVLLLAMGNDARAYTGLWRSLQNECKLWDIRLVIADKTTDLQVAVSTEIAKGQHDECSIWNGNERKALRLQRMDVQQPNEKIDWTGKHILISGGAGGVGLQLKDWLLNKGVAKIYLTGRSASVNNIMPDARVFYLQSDISESFPLIKEELFAIFHLAGVVSDNPFWKQNSESLYAVLKPKVSGTEHILNYAKGHDVKHVVLFSSSACMLGTIGQTNHALASAWLQHKAAKNNDVNITSIAWGPWKGAGAVEKYKVNDIASRIGVSATDAAANFDMMEQLMLSSATTGIFKADWNTYASQMKVTPYLQGLIEKSVDTLPGMPVDFEDMMLDGNMDTIINYLRGVVSKVLGYNETQLFDTEAGFFDIGLDSLTALDLKARLQEVTQQEIPSTLVFKYPNIKSLANYLTEIYTVEETVSMAEIEEKWDESVDALKFIEEEFNNLFDEGTTVK